MNTDVSVDPPGFASLVLAPNAGPMTLEGTNTWVLRAPGSTSVVVVDPGPPDERHLEAVAAHGDIALVVLTHGHLDHSEGVPLLRAMSGAPVVATDPALCADAAPLVDESVLDVAGVRIRTLVTPGHSSDSTCFVVSDGDAAAVLTGDTVLGRGTTVVVHPDGRLADYLSSLRRLDELGALAVLPGHGPVRPDVSVAASEYLLHRMERLEQVRVALQAGAESVDDVVAAVYPDLDASLHGAAAMSVEAQLAYLRENE